MLEGHFESWIAYIDPDLVGAVGDQTVKAPISEPDGRKLSWEKCAREWIGKILNSSPSFPPQDNDCWMIKPTGGDTSGYIIKKFSTSGEANKHQVHRVIYMLQNPGAKKRLEQDKQLVLAHLCGRGRYNTSIDFCCVNHFHLVATSQWESVDRNRCMCSMARWCPHNVKCIFTSRRGQYLWCRNNADAVVYPCVCGRGCCDDLEDADGQQV